MVLVGAGLAGSLLGILLARLGYAVEVYESRPDMRHTDIAAGRSINLALSARGLHALSQAGLQDDIMQMVIPMRGRMVHDLDGSQHLVPYGQTPAEVIYSISRGDLNKRLMTAAEATGAVTFSFGSRCTGLDLEGGRLFLQDEETGRTRRLTAPHVIGCDGAGSVVRGAVLAHHGVAFAPGFLAHGYKELTIPPAGRGRHRLDPHALHIWPRRSFMLIALPNPDGSFTCTLFLQRTGPVSFSAIPDARTLHAFFEAHFPDAVPLMPDLEERFFENPVGPLGTIKCSPWHVDDAALILGDAAHAIVPFFGQGMNCAFEDCVTLAEILAEAQASPASAFARFEAVRKPNTDAIADLSLKNFLEMRDSVADPRFLLRKQLELALEKRHPGVFIPQYAMVSFHRIPYAEVLRRGTLQEDILARLLTNVSSIEQVDWHRADTLITAALSPVEG